jgi:hypothetical protein
MLAVYVSWWTLALALAGIVCLIGAVALSALPRARRLAVAAVGVLLVGAWIAADLVGPGPALFRDSDPALDPDSTFYSVQGFPYRQLSYQCRTEAEMRESGVYAGALRLEGPLVPIGHMVGWFGGPEVFRESGSPSSAPVYADIGGDCYVTYVTIVG